MTKFIAAVAFASLIVIEPAIAGTLSEPVLDQQIVMDAAVEDSTAKVDILMITLISVFMIAIAGGAF
ncbi:hypothetical protein [Roseovarius atlanticus]|uniref:hypothetical protein n=1 Tax=Roseovarius atlanticus TaxID=1641875 RepID=UPI000AE29EDE|nr:hypothetical protein [Roseovarius atlanticus]